MKVSVGWNGKLLLGIKASIKCCFVLNINYGKSEMQRSKKV